MSRLQAFRPFQPLPRLPQLPSLAPPTLNMAPISFPGRIPRAIPPQPVTEEEESSLLGNVISGAAAVGNVLDLPGSAVRDVLSGQNPFDQFLTPFSPENRVSGRQLLRKGGVIGGQDTWMNFAGGLAAEVALDPLTWISGPLGTLAKGSGVGLKAAGKASASVHNLTKAASAARTAAGVARTAGKADEVTKLLKKADDFDALLDFTKKDPIKAAARAEESLDDIKLITEANTAKGARPVDFMSNTPADIFDQIRRGERGYLGIRVPFTNIQLASLGVGSERAAKVLEAAFYADKGLASVANIPIRTLRSLFSSTAGGVVGGKAQYAKDIAAGRGILMHSAIQNLNPHLIRMQAELGETYAEVAKFHDALGDADGFARFTKAAVEQKDGLKDTNDVMALLKDHLEVTGELGAKGERFSDLTYKYLDTLRGSEDTLFARVLSMGLKSKTLDDIYVEHGLGRLKTTAKTRLDPKKARRDILRNYPDGSSGINRAVMDPLLTATKHIGKGLSASEADAARATLLRELRTWLADESTRVQGGIDFQHLNKTSDIGDLQDLYLEHKHFVPALDKAWDGRAPFTRKGKDISSDQQYDEWLQQTEHTDAHGGTRIGPSRLTQFRRYLNARSRKDLEQGLFTRQSLEEWQQYMQSMIATDSVMTAAHAMLKRKGGLHEAQEALSSATGVPLTTAWKEAGFTDVGLETLMKDMGHEAGTQTRLFVDPKVADALKSFSMAQDPRKLGEVAKSWDRVTAAYKGSLTQAWPSFHMRNLGSGFWQSISDGKISPGKIAGGYRAAMAHIFGGKPLEFLDEAIANDVLAGHGTQAMVLGDEAAAGLTTLPTAKGLVPQLQKLLTREGINPINARGVRKHVGELKPGEDIPLNVWSAWGENMYAAVEFVNRAGYYSALRKDGYTAAQAVEAVRRSQFDYSQLSRFEKDIMRKIGPLFYGWMRKSIPFTIQKILERPGGITSQTIRGFNVAQKESKGYTPSFLRERLAVPLGDPTASGDQTFLTDPGLPIGDLGTLQFTKRGLNLRRTAEKFASNLHPLISAPIEQFAGRQFYSGRPLKHLKSTTERLTGTQMPMLDRALAIGPWSRAVHELTGKPFDSRKSLLQKAVNIGTGVKLSTYDAEKWKAIDAAQAITDALERDPSIGQGHYNYVRKTHEDVISPEARLSLARARRLQDWISLHAAEREAAAVQRELSSSGT